MTEGDRHELRTAVRMTALPLHIRDVESDEDIEYAVTGWLEDYKYSPEARSLSWQTYKRLIKPEIHAVARRRDTRMLGAYTDNDRLCGWICYSPGRRVSTVHWIRTRLALGRDPARELRRTGIMRRLVDAAQLGDRIVYTFRGPRAKDSSETSDQWISRWLENRGQHAAYQSIQEWMK